MPRRDARGRLRPEDMHPSYRRSRPIRQALDQFGQTAVKLELELFKLGDQLTSERLLAIARALREAYLHGQAEPKVDDTIADLGADSPTDGPA